MGVADLMDRDPAKEDKLILVDGLDREVGTASKERAHREGLLHRAFSVVLVRPGDEGVELLLAQRALCKYHAAGLWANSCCSHPRAGEDTCEAAYRRVYEELGTRALDLREIGAFVYRAEFSNGLVEYEYDHVFVGRCEGGLAPNADEVEATRWVGVEDLARQLPAEPRHFAPWAYTVLSMALLDGQRGRGSLSAP